MTKIIYLSGKLAEQNSVYALIDDQDFDLVTSFGKWYLSDTGYAVKKTRLNGRNITYRMHSVVNETPKGLVTDHINGNRLDNRRANLRAVSQQINNWNTERAKQATEVYHLPRGVSFDKQRNKFVASQVIRRRFDTLEEATNFVNGGEKLYERN